MNKFRPHIWVIPEDRANVQLANGFVLHDRVDEARIQVVHAAGGWMKVLAIFEEEYIPSLRKHQHAHVVMLIDFDEDRGRRALFEQRIPEELKARVFVVGSRDKPETLKREVNKPFEEIGRSLAQECH